MVEEQKTFKSFHLCGARDQIVTFTPFMLFFPCVCVCVKEHGLLELKHSTYMCTCVEPLHIFLAFAKWLASGFC